MIDISLHKLILGDYFLLNLQDNINVEFSAVGRGRGNKETTGRGRGIAAGCGVLNLPGQSLTNGYISKPPITNNNNPPG